MLLDYLCHDICRLTILLHTQFHLLHWTCPCRFPCSFSTLHGTHSHLATKMYPFHGTYHSPSRHRTLLHCLFYMSPSRDICLFTKVPHICCHQWKIKSQSHGINLTSNLLHKMNHHGKLSSLNLQDCHLTKFLYI